ncbi:MAG: hypothetical protein ACKOCG_02150, partial [Candidatus Nanopelagicus sp.]
MIKSSKGASRFLSLIRVFKPSKTIPITPWRADSTWAIGLEKQHLQRIFILIFGLTIFGIG